MGLQNAVLAGRRLIETTLLDEARLYRRAVASDGAGGQVEAFPADASAVACKFSSIVDPSPVEQVEGIFGVPTATVFFALTTEGASAVGLHEGDQVVNLADSSRWVVVGSKTPASAFAVVDRVLIREV